MKKNLLLAALALVVAAACQKTEVPELTVSTTTINLGPAGGNQMITVTSNQDWTVTTSDSWINVGSTSGSGTLSFAVNVGQFTEASQRPGCGEVGHPLPDYCRGAERPGGPGRNFHQQFQGHRPRWNI